MMPMGPVEFSPAEVALILAVLALIGTCLALPATITLAVVGFRRAVYHPAWNATWYWLWGNVLTLVVMGALYNSDLGWFRLPISWFPGLILALLLNPRHRRRRPGPELGWTDTTAR
jgi:urea transporter